MKGFDFYFDLFLKGVTLKTSTSSIFSLIGRTTINMRVVSKKHPLLCNSNNPSELRHHSTDNAGERNKFSYKHKPYDYKLFLSLSFYKI